MKTSVLDVEYDTRVVVAYLDTASPFCFHMLLLHLEAGRVLFVLGVFPGYFEHPVAGVTIIVTRLQRTPP